MQCICTDSSSPEYIPNLSRRRPALWNSLWVDNPDERFQGFVPEKWVLTTFPQYQQADTLLTSRFTWRQAPQFVAWNSTFVPYCNTHTNRLNTGRNNSDQNVIPKHASMMQILKHCSQNYCWSVAPALQHPSETGESLGRVEFWSVNAESILKR